MPVSVVVGGQYGGEGKGKVTNYFARQFNAKAVVRVGGPNSGHTVVHNDVRYKLRVLSSACMLSDVITVLPVGSYINIELLEKELKLLDNFNIKERLIIDKNAMIIDNFDSFMEKEARLKETIASTTSGIGNAIQRRIKRDVDEDIKFAKDDVRLRSYVMDTSQLYNKLLRSNEHIIVEGTQGFGLSVLHSDYYPYCTARDTTASAFLMEAGLSPLNVINIIMVIRRYPIRVGGYSGHLNKEITWEEVTRKSGSKEQLMEYTTVTNNLRRVAEFDADLVNKAISVNNPNIIVLNHEDYIDYENNENNKLTEKQLADINVIQNDIGRKIDYVGNGESLIIKL